MFAKIYQPAPNAMQSGRVGSDQWVIEFSPRGKRTVDPLTGTYRSTDVQAQLDLRFDTLEQAVSYAKANNIPHQVVKSAPVKRISRSYADNFAYNRRLPWTH